VHEPLGGAMAKRGSAILQRPLARDDSGLFIVRVLGVDWGAARIGLAVGESEFGITTARPPILASGTLAIDAGAIAELAKREQVDAVAVGTPNHEDGRMAGICAKLADRIREHNLDVYMVDESWSTREAEDALRTTDLRAKGRRKRRDGESARIILERFFDEQKETR
jgi:putative transcription antitermination factor YqgF